MNELLLGILVSMLPISELQGGIPIALASGINPWIVFVLCYFANLLVIPILYFFLEFIHHKFLHVNSYQSIIDKVMERCRRKVHPYIDKYGLIGFTLFVAIPTPGTGAYTATLGAWFLGMNKWQAFVSISIGILINAFIVFGISVGGMRLFSII